MQFLNVAIRRASAREILQKIGRRQKTTKMPPAELEYAESMRTYHKTKYDAVRGLFSGGLN